MTMLGLQNDHLDAIITHDELMETARSIASLQLPNGMIPWFEGGHCDPWNHVETAMALDVMGFHDEAQRAYRNWEKSETESNKAMREAILGAPKRAYEAVKGMFSSEKPPAGSVTKTEKSVTVSPGKRRGGRC